MLKLIPVTLALIVTASVFSINAQSTTERSVLAFYDSYAEDLRQHRREVL